MNLHLKQFIDQNLPKIEEAMHRQLANNDVPETLREAMVYSVEAGGKRIRPLLILAVLEDLKVTNEDAYIVAAAVEFIHTYSLIHDDLPCMDDDDYRRGKLTNHKVFGEDVAVLAGDALQALAFECLTSLQQTSSANALELVRLLSAASGAAGMVKGQILDMEGERQVLPLAELEAVHLHKTGALLSFCIEAGAVLAGATEEQQEKFRVFSREIGLAFQIQDDILDITSTTEQLGKPANSDTDSEKSTYPSILGLEGAKIQLKEKHGKAIQALDDLRLEESILRALADYIIERNV